MAAQRIDQVPPAQTISQRIATFADGLRYDHIPDAVTERAKLLVLDCIGIALASGTYEFAHRAHSAITDVADGQPGQATVIGSAGALPLRDAVYLNGLLVHGLDFDDTHPGGVIHASASAFPTALGVAETRQLSGRDLLLGYVLGVEVATRLGIAVKGAFHQVGFHPTGVMGAFGAAVLAARMRGLPAEAIATAQGFVGSQAAGSLQFLETGAWTKRTHPGWAGVCGITSAAFAAHGFESPPSIYEGRFGLYASHLGAKGAADIAACTKGLGEEWETLRVAVKPFPACHFTHAFADAVIALRDQHGLAPEDVASIRCLIADGEMKTVCEPEETKRLPRSTYDAQFSVPFVVGAALVRGRLTLTEIGEESLTDPVILATAQKVTCEPDPDSGFPELFSGEVIVETTDGRTLRHREQVNRGAASRPLSAQDITRKFEENARLALGAERREQIRSAVLALDTVADVREMTPLLGRRAVR
ncbi:MAG: MmgE/PrpD family protein [Euzebyales bacterium]|nr:MmgE/PrpD family protein [Euzebyales bacterium]